MLLQTKLKVCFARKSGCRGIGLVVLVGLPEETGGRGTMASLSRTASPKELSPGLNCMSRESQGTNGEKAQAWLKDMRGTFALDSLLSKAFAEPRSPTSGWKRREAVQCSYHCCPSSNHCRKCGSQTVLPAPKSPPTTADAFNHHQSPDAFLPQRYVRRNPSVETSYTH